MTLFTPRWEESMLLRERAERGVRASCGCAVLSLHHLQQPLACGSWLDALPPALPVPLPLPVNPGKQDSRKRSEA
jgi:hypothetical protein